jgi:hypothetical protein
MRTPSILLAAGRYTSPNGPPIDSARGYPGSPPLLGGTVRSVPRNTVSIGSGRRPDPPGQQGLQDRVRVEAFARRTALVRLAVEPGARWDVEMALGVIA